jgi:hypothetical protein
MMQRLIRNIINDTLYSHPEGFDFKKASFASYCNGNWEPLKEMFLRAQVEGYLKIIADPECIDDDEICVRGIKCIPESFSLKD